MEITMAYGKKIEDLLPKADPYVRAILTFIIPICEELETRMSLKKKTTFTRILYLAVNRLKNDKTLLENLRKTYKCIFVDEAQDLQPLTRQLIRLLVGKEQNLFAIGDDYQSIYSFAGSDPSFIVKFEHYFPEAKVMDLKYNYRCHPGIVDISNKIIRNNKVQRFKAVKGILSENQSENDKVMTIIKVADAPGYKDAMADYLLSQIPENEDIQILGRYSEVMPEIEPYMRVINQKFNGRKYKYLTIHKSKGLQADNVIILGCVSREDGAYCFPAKDNSHRIKDRILALCRGSKFNLTEEETRLFYVAVTRAKKRVFVVTVKGQESEFIGEEYLPQDMVKDFAIGMDSES
jgi:DNA helicase-4